MNAAALQAVAPVLLVRDLSAAVGCYRDQLGFSCALRDEAAAVARDGLTLMLKQARTAASIRERVSAAY